MNKMKSNTTTIKPVFGYKWADIKKYFHKKTLIKDPKTSEYMMRLIATEFSRIEHDRRSQVARRAWQTRKAQKAN